MNPRSLAVLLAALAPVALGARAAAQSPDELRQQLTRAQRDLQQVRSDTDALLDARIRHDLGLPQEQVPEVFRTPAPATAAAMDRARQVLASEETTTASLLGRFQQLRTQVEALQQEARQRAAAQRETDEWLTVPAPAAPRDPEPWAPLPVDDAPTSRAGDVPAGASPGGEVAPQPVRVVANLPSIKAQIHGSSDHGRVAQSLFKAGQALVDRAEQLTEQGHGEAAGAVYDEARQRLQRALDELAPVLDVPRPEFADRFYLGKCRELLFRIAERRDGLSLARDPREYQRREQEVRDPFVAITAADVIVRGNVEQLGPWGRAAQAAMDHFRWMNLHARYAPKTDIDSITWPGRTQR
ncbi:MAG: hypothetical protein AB7O97_03500 [Planctomycetota bacterium]